LGRVLEEEADAVTQIKASDATLIAIREPWSQRAAIACVSSRPLRLVLWTHPRSGDGVKLSPSSSKGRFRLCIVESTKIYRELFEILSRETQNIHAKPPGLWPPKFRRSSVTCTDTQREAVFQFSPGFGDDSRLDAGAPDQLLRTNVRARVANRMGKFLAEWSPWACGKIFFPTAIWRDLPRITAIWREAMRRQGEGRAAHLKCR
jgi:hypothetical protein